MGRPSSVWDFRGWEKGGGAERAAAPGGGEAPAGGGAPPQVGAGRAPPAEAFRLVVQAHRDGVVAQRAGAGGPRLPGACGVGGDHVRRYCTAFTMSKIGRRSEEHTSELQSQSNLVCRLLLEK